MGGQERVLAILKSGDILGEMSHFDDAPRSATATAVGTLNILAFGRENFGMIFELHHKWTLYLIQALATRCAGTFHRLVAAHDGPPPAPKAPDPLPAGFAAERVEKFVTEIRTAIQGGAAFANLRSKALGRYSAEQRAKIEELFNYAEKRLRGEGLIA